MDGLALELGVKKVQVVANKISCAEDEDFVLAKIPPEDFLGFIHYDDNIIKADGLAAHLLTTASLLLRKYGKLKKSLTRALPGNERQSKGCGALK